jgi:CTP synthase
MTITIVEHDTAEPALYGAMAAVVARERGAKLAHLPALFDTRLYPDAVQHVAAEGALVPSGLLWIERLTGMEIGRETTSETLLAQAQSHDIVLPWHAPVAADREALSLLVKRASAQRIGVEYLTVTEEAASWRMRSSQGSILEEAITHWRRDRFGRPKAVESAEPPARSESKLRIGLVGAERDHRRVYPALLAALGDCGDAERANIDVVFISPIGLKRRDVDGILAEIDGLLLPGGSDMANVPGQILMADGALRLGKPTLGLCLGMQTMATAVAQNALHSTMANLAEADPSAPIKTFIPLSEDGSFLSAHRLGERKIAIAANTRLHNLLGPEATMRLNHRFRLNPELLPILAKAGLCISANDGSGGIADAIELEDHPFYLGVQGHPELSSRSGRAHPLMRAFLQACL